MSQRIALWMSAALSIAFALIVSAVLVGPSITTADPADSRYAAQQTDAINRGDWAQLDWFGQPVSSTQAAMWQADGANADLVAMSYDDHDDKDKHDDDHDKKDKKDKKDKRDKHDDDHDKKDDHDEEHHD